MQLLRKDVLVCDMDQTLGDWKKEGYYDDVPGVLKRQRQRGVEPIVFTYGSDKKKRLSYLNPQKDIALVNHIWTVPDDIKSKNFFVDDDGDFYELGSDEWNDLRNPNAVWRRTLPDWCIALNNQVSELNMKIVELQDEAALAFHDERHDDEVIFRVQVSNLKSQLEYICASDDYKLMADLLSVELYTHVKTGVQIRPYFPPVLKDIRLLHWIMRNQFFKEINSVMVGDSLEKRVCLKSKVWKMPFFCTKDSVSWAVDGAAEAVFDRMFGVRKSTAQVYDDMYSNGVPVEGRDDARVLILGDRKVEFEHFPEGLRFMSAA